MKKNLIISLSIAVIYVAFSLAYFFGGFYHAKPGSVFELFEIIIVLPAAIIFGAGFTGGNIYGTGFLIVLIIWIVFFSITFIIKNLISLFKKINE